MTTRRWSLPPASSLGAAAALCLSALVPALAPAYAEDGTDQRLSLEDASRAAVVRDRDDDAPSRPFARVRYEDNGVRVVRRDGLDQDLAFNAPVYDGDRVETRGDQRAELQFPDGTLVRVDGGVALEIYDIADDARDGATLLGLGSGAMQADVPDPRDGNGVRIDTPAASIYPIERSSFRVDIEDGDSVRVSVERGRVEVAGEENTVVLRSGERTRVIVGGRARTPWAYNVLVRDGFDGWVGRRDDVYRLRAAPGREYNDLPDEVRPYYAELSRNGEWVWTDDYGWTWKPGAVDRDWRPYWNGAWADGPWGPVWVGSEPWGWATYRYGRWSWNLRFGWIWVPGRVFAPAHVYWYYGPSYIGWAPLDYWDRPVHVSIGFSWGDPWFDGCPWAFVPYNHFYWHNVPRHIVPRRAIAVRDLREGVVGRHSVVVPGRGTVVVDRRTVRPLSDETFKRARQAATRHESLRGVPDRREDRDQVVREGRSFRDRERAAIDRRGSRRGEGDTRIGGPGAFPGRSADRDNRGPRAGSGTTVVRPDRGGRGGGEGAGRGGSGGSSGGSGRQAAPRGGRRSDAAPVQGSDERSVIRIRPAEPSAPAVQEDGRDDRDDRGGRDDRSGREAQRLPRFERGEAERSDSGRGRAGAGRAEGDREGTPRTDTDANEGVRRFFGRIAEEDQPAARTAPERSVAPRGFERRPADPPAARRGAAPDRSREQTDGRDGGGRDERVAPAAPPPRPADPPRTPDRPSAGPSRGGRDGERAPAAPSAPRVAPPSRPAAPAAPARPPAPSPPPSKPSKGSGEGGQKAGRR